MNKSLFLYNKVYCEDARTFLQSLPDESVDLVFTDPPYPKKYLECFQILADECPRIMKRGASLVTLLGHYQLEMVMKMFMGRLKYRWELNMYQSENARARMAMGIEVLWKPALWYVKEAYPNGRGYLRDSVAVTRSKGSHPWEQGIEWSDYYIPRLCPEDGIMVDPFCGSGTFLESAIKFKRNFFACDIDANAVEITNERIKLSHEKSIVG